MDGETKSVCLSGFMIGVLSENDYFDFVEWTVFERTEDTGTRRIDGSLAVFFFNKGDQLAEISLLKLRT